MKRNDLIILSIILVLALLCGGIFKLTNNKNFDNKYIVITVDGKEFKRILHSDSLNDEILVETTYGHNDILIENGKVSIAESDCTNQVCVQSGSIDKVGQTLVCLPNKLIIEIKGVKKSGDDPDYIAH